MLKITLILAVVVLATSGCATTGQLRSEPLETGTEQEFAGEYATVLRAARGAVVGAGLAIDTFSEVDAATAIIVAKKGATMFSWGELVRVVVQQAAPDRTVVRVLTKRRVATNAGAKGDYAETIFSNIALALR